MRELKEKYGVVNLVILIFCIMVLLINAFTPAIEDLQELSTNKGLAYVLNLLLADKGKLIKYGSMSYETFFKKGQWWGAEMILALGEVLWEYQPIVEY